MVLENKKDAMASLSRQEGSTRGYLANAQYVTGLAGGNTGWLLTPQPLTAVGVLFSPIVSGWVGSRTGGQVAGKSLSGVVGMQPHGMTLI